jgi:outer membrane lipoprotein-sorting protein
MNPNSQHDNPDDLLNRSLNALRNAPIADGPSSKVLADTLAALRSAPDTSPTLKLKRFTNMKFITRFAASILLVCGIAALFFFSLHPSIALADVVKKVREAKTISFTTRTEFQGMKDQGPTKVLVDNAGHMRLEQPTGIIVTLDTSKGKSLMIEPKTKTAMVMNFDNPAHPAPGVPDTDPLAELKALQEKSSKSLGEKEIDGRKVKGFVAREGSNDVTIWADAKSGDPVRAEIQMPLMGKQATVVLSDFVLNPTVDAASFSLEAPEGYHLRQVQLPKISQDGEKNLIEALRGFAERAQGRFPKRIDQWNEFAALAKGDPKNHGELDEATTQWMSYVGATTPFLASLPKEEHAYLGSGARLNDKNKIIFWYQNPDTKTYRAIYADLTAKDADRATLPKAPPPAPVPPTPIPTKQ